jgi:PilZ domain
MTRDSVLRRVERRRSPRYHYRASVEIEWGSARLRARTRDISENGMFIESEDVLWVGAGFRARLSTESPVWLDCSVKRVEPGRGMGVTISVFENQHQQNYLQLLSKLAASSAPPYTNGDETLS